MAKKIRFPLEMDNGVEVRDMEGLREHFSLAKVLEYFENGKLAVWLRDHYENDIADAVEALGKDEQDLAKKLSEIFDVPYDENAEEELEKAAERAERLKRLKEYTEDEQFWDKVDNVAFEQDELYDLLDEDAETIYLCGERFSIPLSKSGVQYIGINNPTVVVDSKVLVDWEEKRIVLEGVAFDDKYQAVIDSANGEDSVNESAEQRDSAKTVVIGAYSENNYLPLRDDSISFAHKGMFSYVDWNHVVKLYDKIKPELEKLNYDVEEDKERAKEEMYNYGDYPSSHYIEIIKEMNDAMDRRGKSKENLDRDFSVYSDYGVQCYCREMKMSICDTPLAFIYNYNKNNCYARIIMRISRFSFQWESEDANKTTENLADFVQYCEVEERYQFLFWALMIMTVDKTDAEKHLSSICQFVEILCITENELEDIIRVVKIIYNPNESQNFNTDNIPSFFKKVLKLTGRKSFRIAKKKKNELKDANIRKSDKEPTLFDKWLAIAEEKSDDDVKQLIDNCIEEIHAYIFNNRNDEIVKDAISMLSAEELNDSMEWIAKEIFNRNITFISSIKKAETCQQQLSNLLNNYRDVLYDNKPFTRSLHESCESFTSLLAESLRLKK